MDIVIWLVVFGMYFFLCKLLWSWNWAKPKSNLDKASKKRIKNLKEQLSEVETQRRVGQTLAVASMFGKVPLIGFTKERRETIRLLLQAVDKRDARDRAIMPEEIYVQQLQMVALLISFTCAVAVILRQPFVLLVLLASPIVMASMLGDLQKEREDTSQAISSEFLAFYKVYYVQFSHRDVTNTLANVVRSFMPRASDAFKKALGRFAGDLESGEDYALHAFDARFPENMKVHKFCAIARARAKGDDAAFLSMQSFLQEMEEQRDTYFELQLEKRKVMIDRLILVCLMTVFTGIFIVLMIGMMSA